MSDLSPNQVEQLSKADPYTKIVEDLDEACDVLKIIALAMDNPHRLEIWEDDPCKSALERALDTVLSARDYAVSQHKEIWEAAKWMK